MGTLGTIDFPLRLRETGRPDAGAAAIFRRAFHCEPPHDPRHFSAVYRSDGEAERVTGYVHFIPLESGIYLCGGLCVDSRAYRVLSQAQRDAVASQGSMARWLLRESIDALGPKQAVFAFTGDARSRRDAIALGFEPTASRYLLVQWHGADPAQRPDLIRRAVAIGPF